MEIQSEGVLIIKFALEESEFKWSWNRMLLKTILLELSDLFYMN
jgi:hypothetical protein